jgi:hypothetical protein
MDYELHRELESISDDQLVALMDEMEADWAIGRNRPSLPLRKALKDRHNSLSIDTAIVAAAALRFRDLHKKRLQ